MLVPVLTVAENIVLGDEPHATGRLLDRRAARAAHPRALRALRAARWTRDAMIEDLPVGAAAARRDPQGALPRRQHPDPRRADGRAHAAGGRRAVRDHARADGARQVDHLHHATSCKEVLAVADRITVLRARQAASDALSATATTERALAPHDGRPRRAALRVDKTEAHPGEAVLQVGPVRVQIGRGDAERCEASRSRCHAGRDGGDRGSRGQRPDGAGRGDHRPGHVVRGQVRPRRQDVTPDPARDQRRGHRPHPGGSPSSAALVAGLRPCAENLRSWHDWQRDARRYGSDRQRPNEPRERKL